MMFNLSSKHLEEDTLLLFKRHPLLFGLIMIIFFLGPAESGTIKTKTYKAKIGPLQVNGQIFTIELKKRKILGMAEQIHFTETIESFEIKDGKGKTHYKKYLGAVLDTYGFTEELSMRGFVLEGEKGKGLIIYYEAIPSAPGSGISLQLFSVKRGRLAPISLPITAYGEVSLLPKGSTKNSLRLSKGDIMKFKVWTGNFLIAVPLLVDWEEKDIKPLKKEGEFDIEVKGYPIEEEGIVHLFAEPNPSALPKEMSVKKDSRIRFLKAYGTVHIQRFGAPEKEFLYVDINEPWLKVVVDGIEGWVKDWEDLNALGLPSAG